jgi:hypothetical protein
MKASKLTTTGRSFTLLHFDYHEPDVDLKPSVVRFGYAYAYKFETGLATINASVRMIVDKSDEEFAEINAEMMLAQAEYGTPDPEHIAALVHLTLEEAIKALKVRIVDTAAEDIPVPSFDRNSIYLEVLDRMNAQPSKSINIYGFTVKIEKKGNEELYEKVEEALRSFEPGYVYPNDHEITVTYSIDRPIKMQDGPQAWNAVNDIKNQSRDNYEKIFLTDPWIERKNL